MKKDDVILEDLPVCSALLQMTHSGGYALATGTVLGYAKTNWYRTLVLLADRFLLVMDRIQIVNPRFDNAHIEWNGLGDLRRTLMGICLNKKGSSCR